MKIIEQGYILDVEKVTGPKQVCIFTSLLRLSTGRILAGYRWGSGKDSADGNGLLLESVDGGRAWSVLCDQFDSVVGGKPGEIRAVEVLERDDRTLVALLSWFDRAGGAKLYDSAADTLLPAKILAAESGDGGRTWQNYRVLSTGALEGTSLTGQVLRIPGQGWLAFFEKYAPEATGGPNLHAGQALVSVDGRSFERIINVARHPENKLFYWDQRQAVCPRTGRIVSMFWTYDRQREKDEPIHLAWGDPATWQWTGPVSTGIQGQICMPVPLRDGRLLAFYVHRHAPGSMRLVASSDGGKTWDTAGELVVYQTAAGKERGVDTKSGYGEYWDDMQTWCFGHPSALVLDEGTVLLAYYGGKSKTSLSARWALVEV